jgi:NADH-quinone oxidoreductase subunit L
MTFIIASLSISGIFPLSGFWSKDEIIASTLGSNPIFLVGALLVAFMTSFYMFRLCFLTFFGTPRNQEKYDHAHESPRSMTWPLIFLAVLSVCAGWWGIPWLKKGYSMVIYTFNGHPHHAEAHILLMLASTVIAVSGIVLAYLMYYKKSISPEAMAQRFKPIYTFLYNKWYFDEAYDFLIVRPAYALARFLWAFDARIIDGLVNLHATVTIWLSTVKLWIDVYIVDGIVNGLGLVTGAASSVLRLLQSGRLAHYLLVILFGLIVMGLLASSNLLNWAFLEVGIH